MDRGKEYLAHFARVEKAGGLWKEVFSKTVREMQVDGLEDVITTTSIVTQCRNAFPRSSGCAPNQWVLGMPQIRLPGSLLLDEGDARLEILEGAEDPHSALARMLGLREGVKVAQIKMDTDGRVRRAPLHQSTPTRGPFPVTSYVYFYRAQTQPGTSRTYKWYGPARVIGVELRNQRRSADPEVPTSGGQPHSCWLRYGASVLLVTGEQLRFASEDELLAAHMIPAAALESPYARGARNYLDFRSFGALQPPPPQEGLEGGSEATIGLPVRHVTSPAPTSYDRTRNRSSCTTSIPTFSS